MAAIVAKHCVASPRRYAICRCFAVLSSGHSTTNSTCSGLCGEISLKFSLALTFSRPLFFYWAFFVNFSQLRWRSPVPQLLFSICIVRRPSSPLTILHDPLSLLLSMLCFHCSTSATDMTWTQSQSLYCVQRLNISDNRLQLLVMNVCLILCIILFLSFVWYELLVFFP